VFKKLLFILLLSLISLSGYGQTVFTQTFIDRCTGDVKVVTANFVNGSATVAFYNRVRLFTYQEALNGTLFHHVPQLHNKHNKHNKLPKLLNKQHKLLQLLPQP
jgi:hypothetical protein